MSDHETIVVAGGGGLAKLVAALQAQLREAGHTIKFLHDCLKHSNSHSYDYPEQTKRVLGDIRAVAPPVKSCHHSRTVDGCSGCASGNRERELFAWIKTKEARQLLESVEHPLPATRSQPGNGDADGDDEIPDDEIEAMVQAITSPADEVRLRCMAMEKALLNFVEPMRRYRKHQTWLKGDEDMLVAAAEYMDAVLNRWQQPLPAAPEGG